MILTDPPYGTTNCKWDSIIPFEPMWTELHRIVKPNGVIVMFSAQPFTTKLINSNLKHYKYNWYWIKNNVTGFAVAKYQPMRKVEDICVFYKKRGTYNPQGLIEVKNPRVRIRNTVDGLYDGTLRKPYISKFTNYPNNVLMYANEASSNKLRYHPTQKPVALLEYLISTYTNEGETVLDFTMGSGSTGVACVNTNRRFIGIELDEQYFNIAKERIKNDKRSNFEPLNGTEKKT